MSIGLAPTVAQQVTWVYANQTSLSSAATFLTLAGFVEIQPLKQKKECRIFHTAPERLPESPLVDVTSVDGAEPLENCARIAPN